MNRVDRQKLIRNLRVLWLKRDIPAPKDAELRRITDRDLAYLLRFWTHKDRHWADEGDDMKLARQPDFTEEPPRGYTAMSLDVFEPAETTVVIRELATDEDRRVRSFPGRTFAGSGGGKLTSRQAMKRN